MAEAAYSQALEQLREWPLDQTTIDYDGRGTVQVAAGRWGVAPVYLTDQDGALRGSWDLADLMTTVRLHDLVSRQVARTLTYWRRYSTDTHFSGIHHLTERATAYFDGARLAIDYPEPAQHANPRALHPDADPVAGFEDLLAEIIGQWPITAETTAVTLSGGIDSANVAATLGDLHPGSVTTGAMLIAGQPGIQQRRRRGEMIEGFHLGNDLTVDGDQWEPLRPNGGLRSDTSLDPDEEPFMDAVGAMIDLFAGAGIRTAFGGTGGDEFSALREGERAYPLDAGNWTFPPWMTAHTVDALHDGEKALAPASVISEVTLIGFACHNPLYLRRGLWPVEPLAAPELIRFGEWLPVEWRRGKRLLRERLARRGMSADVVRPPLRENLAAMMGEGLRRHGLPLLQHFLRDGLLLADLGYVDADGMRQACRVAQNQRDDDVDRRLYPVLSMEVALRRIAGLSANPSVAPQAG